MVILTSLRGKLDETHPVHRHWPRSFVRLKLDMYKLEIINCFLSQKVT